MTIPFRKQYSGGWYHVMPKSQRVFVTGRGMRGNLVAAADTSDNARDTVRQGFECGAFADVSHQAQSPQKTITLRSASPAIVESIAWLIWSSR